MMIKNRKITTNRSNFDYKTDASSLYVPFFLCDDEQIGKQEDVNSLFVNLAAERKPGFDVAPHEPLHLTFLDKPTRCRHDRNGLDVANVQLIGHDEHLVDSLRFASSFVALLHYLRGVKW